ncbi:pto-interacting protein 1-like [Vicia villosa]|uniref:pto-interacting protein 1-like n=1 Tax=Vicia villosa TaxID=3911 RepID=UPI00273C7E7D|nr:pto-interacting protein 1-like [Vicia villosa]
MGCFGFCKENDSYTTADRGNFMQNNPNAGNSSYHGRHTTVTIPQPINLQPISVPSITIDELKSVTDPLSHADQKRVVLNKTVDSDKRLEYRLSRILIVPSIVELLTYCVYCPFRALAYEYVPNGSFHDILHGRKGVKGAEPGQVLSWAQRVKIAVGTARGLEYLHEKAETCCYECQFMMVAVN